MTISYVDRGNSFRHVSLSGRLDALGIEEIEKQLTKLTGNEKRNILVDLTEVTFLNSTGISELIKNASAQQKLGGKFVLLVCDNTLVAKTLILVGINSLLPICKSYPDAERVLLS
jgi:anti-sigma B factor antagonist